MSNWKTYELENITSIHNGSTPSTKVEDYWNGDIVWVTPKDLSDQNKKYIERGERFITEKGLSKVKSNLLPKGTILLSSRAPIGLLSISKNELVTNQGFKNIIVDEDYLDNEFLYYNLKLRVQDLNNLGTGTTFKELSKTALGKFRINIPNISTQKSISKVLSDLDAKIELNNKINDNLEQLAKTIYDYWFVQFDFPDTNGKPYKSSGGKMVYSKELKQEIPERWSKGTLNDISKIIRGVSYNKHDIKTPNDDNVTPILRATNITGNVIDLENMVYVPNEFVSEKQLMNKYDVLITMSSGSKDHIGKNGMFYFDKKVAFGAFCAKLEANKDYQFYLSSYMKSEFISETVKKECLGTNINNLNGSLIKGFRLVKPNKEVLKNFNKKLKPIHDKIRSNQKENQKLAELRDWLLPMLMNGQVTLRQAQDKAVE